MHFLPREQSKRKEKTAENIAQKVKKRKKEKRLASGNRINVHRIIRMSV